MIGGKMIGHRPISTSQHHPGAQRRQLRTGAIEAEQGQRGHGGRKPGKGMNLATSPQNECENRRRRPSRGLAHTPGTPIFALFRWTSERAASIRCPDGGSGQGSFASFLKGPLPPSGHRIERGTIDLQSDINCLPERSLLGAFGKQHDDYDHDVFNSAGSTLATPHFGPENGVHLKETNVVHTFFYLLPFDVFKCGIVDREVRAEGVTALVSDLEKCSLDTKILFRVLTVKQVPDGDVLRSLSKKKMYGSPNSNPSPELGADKENHTSWERYYQVSDCSSSLRNDWYSGI